MPLMKAVQVDRPGAEFELVQKEIPEPKETEVRIQVEVCGVCRGDALVKEGHYPGISYPRVPGHEVVGRIDKLGSKVIGWETGQRVGVGWYGGPCLQCDACKRGDLTNCKSFLTTGISFDGGYAEYMIAPMQGVAAIPEELASVEAAPLLCAGRTTFTALRSSGAQAGDLVAIQGLGGLGHLAVQFARKFGFRTVAISRGKEKEALAYRLGAHAFIDAESTDAAAELKKLGGARLILATAPSSQAISGVINGLGPDGQVIIVAWSSEPIQILPWQLREGDHSVKGWTGRIARNSSADALRFSALFGVVPMVEVFPLEHAAQAFEKMISSKVHFRSVLQMDGKA
jgi:D-arabinose 1-dehydrogenase-like Zn-dependent alcohol dehydrogenase